MIPIIPYSHYYRVGGPPKLYEDHYSQLATSESFGLSSVVWYRLMDIILILLMDEILHHLRALNYCNS